MALEITTGPSGFTTEPGEAQQPSNKAERAARATSSRQWIRACRLLLGGGGKTLDVSNLRITFEVRQGDVQTPNYAKIKVYNLSDQTANQIKNEFDSVQLEAGYQDSPSVIFKGTLKQKAKGRENPVDTFVELLALDGDKAHNFATVNKTLAAGHTFRDQVDAAHQAMKPYGIELGFVDDLGSRKMPRARVLFGMARDVLRTVGFSTDTSWSIQNGTLQVVKNKGSVPGGPIVLNSQTGMVEMPIQTLNGVVVRCLLNPRIRPGTRVQIDQSSVQSFMQDPGYLSGAQLVPSIAEDGIYRVLVVDHQGDTRGQPWYSDLICIASGDSLPIGLARRGITLPE